MAWKTARLEEVAQVMGGGTPSRTEKAYFGGGIAWATPTDITALDQLYISKTKETITEAGLQSSSAKLMPAGAVLLTSRATIGFTAVSQVPICTNQGFINFICGHELVPEYLAYWLRTQKAKMIQHAGGTTFKEIGRGTIKKFEIPVPPLPEQHRIADLLTRADGIVRLRREAEKKAAELIPALFLDMFGSPAMNPKGWPVATIGELLTDGPQNGLYKHGSHYGEGTPILRIDAFYDGQVRDLKTLKRVTLSPDECARFRLRPRDLIINRVNSPEYLGKSTIIPALDEDTVFESNMMRLTFDEARVLPEYVIELLQTAHAKAHFLSKAKHAINQSSINQQDVKSLGVPIPTLSIQRGFVGKVGQARSIQSQQSTATTKAKATFNALLAQAFSAS